MGSSHSTIEPVEVDEYITAKVNGFVSKDFEAGAETDGWRHSFFGWPWKKPTEVPWKHIFAGFTQQDGIKMHNARKIQEKSNLSPAEFFEKHGFVLCNMPTKVQDWNEDYGKKDTDVSNIYHKEVETALREEIFPKGTEFVHIGQDEAVLRRGPSSNVKFYGSGVHQDYAFTPEHYKETSRSYMPDETIFREFDKNITPHLEESDVFSIVCFWRPINLEEGKVLMNNPICVLDCNSLEKEDIVKTKLFGFSTTGNAMPQLTLKYNETQRWCYYPDMTNDEVLVFKQLYYKKSDPNGAYKSCFHSAFADPREGWSGPSRQSTEHRVRLFIK